MLRRTWILAVLLLGMRSNAVLAQVFVDVANLYGVADSRPGVGAMWLDYDNDRDLDILVSTNYFHTLFRNDGERFVDVAASVGLGSASEMSQNISVGDYDNDGDVDIFISSTEEKNLFRNDLDETDRFTGVGYFGQGTFLDYDNDGDLDIYEENHGPNQLYRNDDGVFTQIPGALGSDDPGYTRTAVCGDYDGDGDMDVYVANGRHQRSSLYRNDVNTSGGFIDVTDQMNVGDAGGGYVNGACWGDYDNDGDLDLYLITLSANRLYRNDVNASGTFTEVAGILGVRGSDTSLGGSWGDYDNDGDLDLYVINNEHSPNRLYRNDVPQGGGFVDTGEMADGQLGWGGSWGDFDRDGDLDFYLVGGTPSIGMTNRLYRNSGNSKHWLHIEAVGTASNRSGIGAGIRVVADDLIQTRYVETMCGFGSQNSLPVEFGLGTHASIDSVVIRWPSGIVQVLTDITPNQYLTVTEPDEEEPTPTGRYVLEFDGVDDFIQVENNQDLDLTDVMTVEAWIYLNSPATHILSKEEDSVTDNQPFGFGVDRDATLSFFYEFSDDTDVSIVGETSLSLQTWYHAAVTVHHGTLRFYVNGRLDAEHANVSAFQVSDGRLFIGRNGERGSGRYFSDDRIGEVRIWNIARTQEEIQADMNHHLEGTEEGLVACWRMEEGEGQVVGDCAGDHDGQLGLTPGVDGCDPIWIRTAGQVVERVSVRLPHRAEVPIERSCEVPVFGSDVTGREFISLQTVLTYDGDVVLPVEIVTDETLTEGWHADFNILAGEGTSVDTLYIAMATGHEPLYGEGELLRVRVEPAAGVSVGDTTVVHFEVFWFNEDMMQVDTEDGVVYIAPWRPGDVTGNGEVSSLDAALILRHAVGRHVLIEVDSMAADVSGDGSISSYDAALILQYVVRKISRFPVEEEGQAKIPHLALSLRRIWNGRMERRADGRMCLPVLIDEMDGVVAGEMMLSFYGDMGDVEIRTSTLTSGYLLAHSVQRGRIRISFAGAESRSGGGRLLEVVFDERDDGTPCLLRLDGVSLNEGRVPTRIVEQEEEAPLVHRLGQNHPNPFNPETTITYDVTKTETVRLSVYALTGQHIRTLTDGQCPAGTYSATWDGTDDTGQAVASGVYLCRMIAGEYRAVRKLLLVR